MRQSQKSNRSRGRGNRNKGGGGGGGNNMNRVYDSAGPEGKVRGTPQQIIEKYVTLARDAQTSGDRVAAENFLQHAEHYQRILISAMSEQEKARQAAQQASEEQDEDEQPSSMQVAEAQPDGGQDRKGKRQQTSDEIDGMATIDSGSEPEGLVIAPEEMTNSQPRQNGSGRRSRRRPPREEGEGEAQDAAPAKSDAGAQAEAAEG